MPAVRSSRGEPDAEREAIEQSPLLLHSLAQFGEAAREPLAIVKPRSIVEIGGEGGRFTTTLLESLAGDSGTLTTIDPEPSAELRRIADRNPAMRLIEQSSPEALDEIEPSDLYVVDGDHNYTVVHAEMEKILAATVDVGRNTLLIMHDVCWPCGRRDFYYSPETLDPGDVHPHSFTAGLIRGTAELAEGRGYRGGGAMAIAREWGGERNGVMTAIEDATAERGGLELHVVRVIFGLAFLFPSDAPWAAALRDFLTPLTRSDLLPTLEQNRLSLLLQVLDLESELERRTAQYNNHLRILENQIGGHPDGALQVDQLEGRTE